MSCFEHSKVLLFTFLWLVCIMFHSFVYTVLFRTTFLAFLVVQFTEVFFLVFHALFAATYSGCVVFFFFFRLFMCIEFDQAQLFSLLLIIFDWFGCMLPNSQILHLEKSGYWSLKAYINPSLTLLGLDTYRGIQPNLPYHSQSLMEGFKVWILSCWKTYIPSTRLRRIHWSNWRL